MAPTKEHWQSLESTRPLIDEWYKLHKGRPFDQSWKTWLFLAGRGSGKTRAGAEWVREQVELHGVRQIALVGPTAADVRDVMVEGPSGILSVCPPWNMPNYIGSKRKVIWPNGAVAKMYSAEEPRRLRGPNMEKAWCDELTSWPDPLAWDMLMFVLRIGKSPQALVTTTSHIGHKLLKKIMNDPRTVRTKGHTYDNEENLALEYIEHLKNTYEGTRLGRQELEGEFIDEGSGVLWTEEMFQYWPEDQDDPIERSVVSVDPSISTNAEGAETGIVVCGKDSKRNGYVMADYSGHYSPNGWAQKAIDAYHLHRCNYIVAEVNNGGEMVVNTIRELDKGVKVKKVCATKGKRTRAEPISMLYEQRRVWHMRKFRKLEEQCVDFNPEVGASPDRVDALVWGMTELLIGKGTPRIRRF